LRKIHVVDVGHDELDMFPSLMVAEVAINDGDGILMGGVKGRVQIGR
jgi:hypothetical protein